MTTVEVFWSSPTTTAPSVLHSSRCCRPSPPEGARPTKKRNARCRCSSRSMDDLVLFPRKYWVMGPRSEGSGVGSVVEEVHREAVGDELLGRQAATLPVLPSHGSGQGIWNDDGGSGGGELNNRGGVYEARSSQIRQHRRPARPDPNNTDDQPGQIRQWLRCFHRTGGQRRKRGRGGAAQGRGAQGGQD